MCDLNLIQQQQTAKIMKNYVHSTMSPGFPPPTHRALASSCNLIVGLHERMTLHTSSSNSTVHAHAHLSVPSGPNKAAVNFNSENNIQRVCDERT